MAAAGAKSRPQTAEAHVEWWSPQQALTMILSGDQATADAAAGQTFAAFVEEMKKRKLAAWIGEALHELYGAIRIGAPLVERESDAPSGLPCRVRGLRFSENAVNVISPDDIRDPARSAACRLEVEGDEIELGANDHIEWRSLEFERAGVQRASIWARREGWLRQRINCIEKAGNQRHFGLLAATHTVMERLHPFGREFAAMLDRSPRLLDHVPPLWLVRQKVSPDAASATWQHAKGLRSRAEELLLTWLGEGRLPSYAKNQKDGLIPRGTWVGSEECVSFESGAIASEGVEEITTHIVKN